jgi:Uma2 family endonuclease
LYPAPTPFPTAADLTAKFGAIPMNRLRLDRYPADESDVEELLITEERKYELVDGFLVEKDMAYRESVVGYTIGRHLGNFVDDHDLGVVAGESGMMKLAPGLIRIPDVSFVGRGQFPEGKVPADVKPIPAIHPDLAVEVLSESNTAEEMSRKLKDYFASGCSLVWFVDPELRTVEVFESKESKSSKTFRVGDTLDGGQVVPGFTVSVAAVFAKLG